MGIKFNDQFRQLCVVEVTSMPAGFPSVCNTHGAKLQMPSLMNGRTGSEKAKQKSL